MDRIPLKKLKTENFEPVAYYMKKFDRSFSMMRHVHPYVEFMYCQSRSFKFEVYEENEKGEKTFNIHEISAGKIIVIDSGIPHRIITDSDAEVMIYNIEFEVKDTKLYNPYGIFDSVTINYSNWFLKSGWNGIINAKDGYTILSDTENVEHCFRTYLNALMAGVNCFEDACVLFARKMILFSQIGKCRQENKPGGYIFYIKNARDYIHKNYAADLSIEDVAEHVKLNKAYLQRLFKTYTGSTILKTINEVRVDKAKCLLAETNESIDYIVAQTGFRNRQHLIYEFKKKLNLTPSAYRKQYGNRRVDYLISDPVSQPFDE